MKTLILTIIMMNTALAKDLTIERIFSSPSLSGVPMRSVMFSPDGVRVTFLQGKADDKDQFDLWQYHIESGKKLILVDSKVLLPEGEKLSAEEKARRERQRTASFTGIVEYSWSQDGAQILFPLSGNLFVYNLLTKAVQQVTDSEDFDTDARFSPNGAYVSFIRKQNIFVVDLHANKTRQLTFDGKDTIKNGMAEFVAQEEMDRDTGYWWSKDEQKIAYIQVDESTVAITQRYEINADTIEIVKQRYPYTGEANVIVKLAIYDLSTDKTQWIDLGNNQDIYLPRVKWLPDSKTLSYQLQSRNQQQLSLNFAQLNGATRKILEENSDTWLNLHSDLYFLKDNDFVWASERDGYKHLYHYDNKGQLLRQITKGQWVVDKIKAIDEDRQLIYYTASKESAIEKHLYSQSMLAGAEGHKVSSKAGWHNITLDDTAQFYIDNWSDRDNPESVALYEITGQLLTVLNDNTINKNHPYYPYLQSHQKTSFGELKTADGQVLHYRIILPKGFMPENKYPVFVYTYGGPHAQMVTNSWGRVIEQYMAQNGFIVFALDNRGSARRGVKFESAIYKHMGGAEIEDQLIGVTYLKSLKYVNADKIGIFGWSYGGFMALKAMTKTDAFAIGVAVAPVTDFALYDTFYTERYMSTPQLNPDGYKSTAVFDDVKNINNPLLVIHGMADDNVLFTNSTKLFKVMQDQGIMFDSMIYPGAKHGISGEKSQIHVWKTISNYFIKHLQTGAAQ
ncbi:MAG: S9 family peptidase [Alcanivoracaceae bacterium]|nr:S9 family peptidase [Alcanivoracaceae bacterium]